MLLVVGVPTDSTITISIPKGLNTEVLKSLLEAAANQYIKLNKEPDDKFPAIEVFDENEITEIINTKSPYLQIIQLVNSLGDPMITASWNANFWSKYNSGDEKTLKLLELLKSNNMEANNYLQGYNLGWLLSFACSQPFHG